MEALAQKIIDSGKISHDALQEKVKEKLSSLGGLISEEGALHIIANELGVALNASAPSPQSTIKSITAGMKSVSALVKVIRKYEMRSFGADGQGKVASLLAGDATGVIRVTFWNDKVDYFEKINEGDVLELQNLYSKENNGRTELHMGNSSHCIINPHGKKVDVKERTEEAAPQANKKTLADINEHDMYVDITATIVQAYDPRFFAKDASTGQKLSDDEAADHDNVEYNYVMNIFLDDGSTNLRAALWKEQVQELLGKSDADILALKDNKEAMEQMKLDLLGTIISARARVKKNEAYNNIELTLYNVNPDPQPSSDAQQQAKAISKEMPAASAASKPVVPAATSSTPVEEDMEDSDLLSVDDEELLSIDDIDEEL